MADLLDLVSSADMFVCLQGLHVLVLLHNVPTLTLTACPSLSGSAEEWFSNFVFCLLRSLLC